MFALPAVCLNVPEPLTPTYTLSAMFSVAPARFTVPTPF